MTQAPEERTRNGDTLARTLLRRALFGIGCVALAAAIWTLVEPTAAPGATQTPEADVTGAVASQSGSTDPEPANRARTDLPATADGASPVDPEARRAAPTHLSIPSAAIDVGIVPVTSHVITIDGQPVLEWEVAEYAAGHHDTSARPGEPGNIVIAGHSDWKGAVFGTLDQVALGDPVLIRTEDGTVHRYRVTEIHYRKERGASLAERLAAGAFIGPTEDERVTLVSCWPPLVNDHRLIVVAHPEETAMTS